MTTFKAVRRVLVAASVAVAALALGGVAGAGPAAPTVPAEIVVPEGHKLFLIGHAVGVQIHTCTYGDGAYRWRFDGPRANVYDDSGKLLMTHSTGPSWQARDGSRAVGTLDGRVTVDPTAIQWLRLKTSTSPGTDGDRLAGTTYIQRIATVGGLAPAAGACNADTLGHTEEVDYTADYTFWKETS